jgi:ribosomal protein S18 acetylase RimI-like enzyme
MPNVIQFNPQIHAESIQQIGSTIFNKTDYALLEQSLETCSVTLSRVLVDSETDEVLGFILLKYTDLYIPLYEISFLGISPNYQGRGAGSLLLRYVESVISPTSAPCWLLVNQDNTSAQNLYSKFGFHILCECLDTYRTRCYIMVRSNGTQTDLDANLNITAYVFNKYVNSTETAYSGI